MDNAIQPRGQPPVQDYQKYETRQAKARRGVSSRKSLAKPKGGNSARTKAGPGGIQGPSRKLGAARPECRT